MCLDVIDVAKPHVANIMRYAFQHCRLVRYTSQCTITTLETIQSNHVMTGLHCRPDHSIVTSDSSEDMR